MAAENNIPSSEPMSEKSICYRLGRQYLFIGLTGTIFFVAMGVWSVYAAYWNIDGSFPHPELHALLYGVFWLCFTGLGLWIIVAYFRERLFVSASGVTQHACVFRRTMLFSEATQVLWKGVPAAGRVQLRSVKTRITIHLGNFTRQERSELIETFRGAFPEDIQVGWTRFFERLHPLQEPAPTPSVKTAILCAFLFFGFAVLFTWCALSGVGYHFFLWGTGCFCGSLLYVWRIYGLVSNSKTV